MPPSPPPVPVGEYSHTRSLCFEPRVLPWIAPVALVLVFVLTFFSWAKVLVIGHKDGEVHQIEGTVGFSPWGLGFTDPVNAPTLLFLLLFILTLVLVGAILVLQLKLVSIKLPAVVQQLWPWRSGILTLCLLITFLFLALQLCLGFHAKHNNVTNEPPLVVETIWAWATLLWHLIALVGALLDFWLEQRGPSRPVPRIDFRW